MFKRNFMVILLVGLIWGLVGCYNNTGTQTASEPSQYMTNFSINYYNPETFESVDNPGEALDSRNVYQSSVISKDIIFLLSFDVLDKALKYDTLNLLLCFSRKSEADVAALYGGNYKELGSSGTWNYTDEIHTEVNIIYEITPDKTHYYICYRLTPQGGTISFKFEMTLKTSSKSMYIFSNDSWFGYGDYSCIFDNASNGFKFLDYSAQRDKKITEYTVPDYINNIPVTYLADFAFSGSDSLKYLTLPTTINTLGESLFTSNLSGDIGPIEKIYYLGTKEQWQKINKSERWVDSSQQLEHEAWDYQTNSFRVVCSDGFFSKAEA